VVRHSRPAAEARDGRFLVRLLGQEHLADGSVVRRLEERLARAQGGEVVMTHSGASALLLALKALGVGPGDEVILPSYICLSVAQSVIHAGARPVLADINSDDFNLSAASAAAKRTRRTRAIVAAHLLGIPIRDMDALKALGVPIIEDCAHALGGRHGGRALGTRGDVAIFSFYATKLVTAARGGALATRVPEIAARARALLVTDKSDELVIGHSIHMDDLRASILLPQLDRLPRLLQARRRLGRFYRRLPDSVPEPSFARRFEDHPLFRCVRMVPDPDAAARRLRAFGVMAERPIYRPLHELFRLSERFPNTERAQAHAVSLPLYPQLTLREAAHVARAFEASRG
jgi:dTDP-4-amino-4,6-dideoxygalactose transaminase